MREQHEIRNRFDQLATQRTPDFFGFRREALLETMDYDTVKDLLKEGTTNDDWDSPDVERTAKEYLVFAIGKAVNHRGISAERSVQKLEEWLWCLGNEELLNRFSSTEYYPYGAPQLRVLEEAWGAEHEYVDDDQWKRMREGMSCTDDCMDGC